MFISKMLKLLTNKLPPTDVTEPVLYFGPPLLKNFDFSSTSPVKLTAPVKAYSQRSERELGLTLHFSIQTLYPSPFIMYKWFISTPGLEFSTDFTPLLPCTLFKSYEELYNLPFGIFYKKGSFTYNFERLQLSHLRHIGCAGSKLFYSEFTVHSPLKKSDVDFLDFIIFP